MTKLLTTEEAAATLRLHPVTLRGMARDGRVDGAVRVGSRWRFREDCTVLPAHPEPPRAAAPRPRRAASTSTLDAAIARHRPTARTTSG